MKQNILIDSQVLQTSAWKRGMGRYLISLIMGLSKIKEGPKLTLIFNKDLVLTRECRKILSKIAPDADLYFLQFAKGMSDLVEERNSRILDEFIEQNKLQSSIFVNGSIFTFDYQPAFPSLTINTCIFYDIIPYKHWNIFNRYFPAEEYSRRFKYIYKCEHIFAISKTVKNDLHNYFLIPENKVTNISGAEIPHFLEHNDYLDSPLFSGRYVLLPGGDSPHKNMLRAIKAFDEFNSQFGDSLRLIITSYYSDENIERMNQLSSNIVLTGNIPENKLRSLYKNAELIIFPSIDEGLGLPLLEAVYYGRKVACSDIPVFREISSSAFYFFDPKNVQDIQRALMDAFVGIDWEHKLKAYNKIRETFTWHETANRLLKALPGIIIAAPKKNSFTQSILVEQDYSLETNKLVSGEVIRNGNLDKITVYCDLLEDYAYNKTTPPFIFMYFLECKDISDFVKSKSLRRSVIITPHSNLSIILGEKLEAQFVGDNKLRRKILREVTSSSHKERVADGT